jgi:membrane protein DedA with SNARE-associated domain
MINDLAQNLVDLIFAWDYIGIFLLMGVESSFVPFPSEIVLIPAGYLVFKGDMNIFFVMISAIGGSMLGAFINYYLAFFLGRKLLYKYGKYIFITQKSLDKMDSFFIKHGAVSTFTGRLIPGIRQLISVPAGLSKMNIKTFCMYTILGSGIWSLILVLLGYFVGENQMLINSYLKQITLIVLGLLILFGVSYTIVQMRKKGD